MLFSVLPWAVGGRSTGVRRRWLTGVRRGWLTRVRRGRLTGVRRGAADKCQEGAADRCQEGSIGCIHIYISITYVGSMGGAQLCKSLPMSPTTQVTTLPLPTSVPSKDNVPRLTSWLKANLVLR